MSITVDHTPIYSGGPLGADIPDIDLASYTLAAARELGDKPALIDGVSGRALSYAELERSVRAFAAGLAARGFEKGDTFAIFMPNAPEYAIAFHGTIAAGGRCTTANPLYTPRELGFQLADSGARMLLTVPAFLTVALEAAAPTGCEVFVLGDADGATPFSELLGDPDDAPVVEIDPATDTAALLYSSGTTGLPKGVMLSHRNLIANMVQVDAVWPVAADEISIAVLPFFHCYGLCAILNLGLRRGSTSITMPRFELEPFVEHCERYRVTRAYLVPPIALALTNDPAVAAHDLTALRAVMSAAAPLGAELADACSARLGCPVIQGFGMTELSPAALLTPLGQAGRPGSVGTVVPGTECRLVDPDTGEDAAPGQRGELWFRGPQVMQRYLNNPDATAAMIDPDGWLHSGDIAVVDDDGWFSIVDRVKELIKYKGFQVAPAELEAILLTHPQVADCAVIGIPDEEAGELPKAFVVPADDQLDAEALMQWTARQVAPHKRIRAVETIDQIPKAASGKILRRLLRGRAS